MSNSIVFLLSILLTKIHFIHLNINWFNILSSEKYILIYEIETKIRIQTSVCTIKICRFNENHRFLPKSCVAVYSDDGSDVDDGKAKFWLSVTQWASLGPTIDGIGTIVVSTNRSESVDCITDCVVVWSTAVRPWCVRVHNRMWTLKFPLNANAFPHMLHLCGFMPEWTNLWAEKLNSLI